MIGLPPQRRAWAGSGAVSLLLHIGVAALLIVDLPHGPSAPAPAPEPRIELIATVTDGGEDGPDAPVLTSTVTASPSDEALTLASLPGEVVRLDSDPILVAPEGEPEPDTAPDAAADPAPGPADTAPLDPRMVELIARIRDNLDEPCLLALPLLRGEDDIVLSVIADNDRRIGPLTARLGDGLDIAVTPEAVLIDPRQCAGANFARNDPLYPAHGLGLQFEGRALESGDSLRGRITGAAGYYNTLLLIDDNGTVHDLRRFVTVAAGQVSFDAPIARAGSSRDTHQLVIAIATADRLSSVTERAGELAESFFPALTAELGGNPALIGVGSVYVR